MANPIEFDTQAPTRISMMPSIGMPSEVLVRRLRFASEVDAALEKIAADPERFAKTYAGCRYCSLKRYPFSVIYYILPSETRLG